MSESVGDSRARRGRTAEWLRARRGPAMLVYWGVAAIALTGFALGAYRPVNIRVDFFLAARPVFAALLAAVALLAVLAGGRPVYRAGAALMALAALAGLTLGAFGAVDERLDLLTNFRGHFALLAFGAAAVSLIGGGRRLALGATALGVLGLAALWPVWRAQATIDEAVAATIEARGDATIGAGGGASCGVETLRVATANLNFENWRPAATAATLLALDADILATQETGAGFWAEADALRARYPYRLELTPNPNGTRFSMLWSRLPLTSRGLGVREWTKPARAFGEVSVGGRRLGVASLHLSRPRHGAQKRQVDGLGPLLSSLPSDRIVMGDFNAAPWTSAMARAERGLGARMIPGLRRTWRGRYPNPLRRFYNLSWRLRRGIPAPLGHQIDHILLSPGLGAREVGAVYLSGSDHRAVVATIDVPRVCGG